jgi:hypothetical protein
MNIGFVYAHGAFGGVERVILERTRVLSTDPEIEKIFLCILNLDPSFRLFLENQIKSNAYLHKLVILDKLEDLDFSTDLVFSIDTPVDGLSVPVIYENHSTYNRSLIDLWKYPTVIVPSQIQKDFLLKNSLARAESIRVLRNPLQLGWMHSSFGASDIKGLSQTKNIIIPSRIDPLKYHHIDALKLACRGFDDVTIHLVGRFATELRDQAFTKYLGDEFIKKISFYGELDFAATDDFLMILGKASGESFLVNLSQNESFNLAGRLAIMAGLKAIVPRIPAHEPLTFPFTFSPTDEQKAATEITSALLNPHSVADLKNETDKYDLGFSEDWALLKNSSFAS